MITSKMLFGSTYKLHYAASKRQSRPRYGHRVIACRWAKEGCGGPRNVLVADINDEGRFVVVPFENLQEDDYTMPKRLGIAQNPLTKISEQYKVWPVTVWDLDYTLPTRKEHRNAIADDGAAREQSGTAGYKTSLGSSANQVSIFNPQVIANIMSLYGETVPEDGWVYDPFGGGGTRAITIAGEGHNYCGIELRGEEVDAIHKRIDNIDAEFNSNLGEKIVMVNADSRDVADFVSDSSMDMLVTCPPYYDLEKYQGGPADLSMAPTYGEFLAMMRDVIIESNRVLLPGALSIWVIGLHRDKDGGLLPMHHDLAYLHRSLGFTFKEEVILHMRNTGSIQRVGNFKKGNHLLIRQHEYCLIFQKPKEEG